MKKYNIQFSPPDISEEEINEVVDTLRSGWITTGPKTKEFERNIADYCHTDKAACLNSATACLEFSLRLLGICKGDEVITTAYTYTATASVIAHAGADIVLVDTKKDSYEIDPEAVSRAVTSRTKAIIAVDIAGIIADYDVLFDIANEKKSLFVPKTDMQKQIGRIAILADGAHSFGAVKNGKRSGEIADFTSFSFHAVKNLTTAEGGALVWNRTLGFDPEELYRQLMLLSLHGQSKDALSKNKLGSWEYDIMAPYYKCNMTDIMAAIGLAQFRRYDSLLKRRREIIEKYDKMLMRKPVSVLNHFGSDHISSGHLYLIRLNGMNREEVNVLIRKMAEQGVATNVHYKPLPMLKAYHDMGFDIKKYPNAFALYENAMTLPLHTKLSDEDVEHVVESLCTSAGWV